MQVRSPYRGRVPSWQSGVFAGIAMFFLGTTLLQAQDVAEAARQEQARKSEAPKHVYTDDDLRKSRILTTEDQAKVEARKRQQERKAEEAKAQPQQPSDQAAQAESLGEIARRLRREKAARETEEAAKKSYTSFPYEVPQPATAEPKASVTRIETVPPNLSKRPDFGDAIRPSAPQKTARAGESRGRVSPFQPRTRMEAAPGIKVSAVPSTLPVSAATPAVSPAISRPVVEHTPEPGFKPVTVQHGDSWWKLAAIYLGSGSRWRELRGWNPEIGGAAELLKSGATVLVPDRESRGGALRPAGQPTQLRLKQGDTLWSLAREHLGRGSAWTCLANGNPQIRDYRRMKIGTVVELPSGDMTGSCAVPSEAP